MIKLSDFKENTVDKVGRFCGVHASIDVDKVQ